MAFPTAINSQITDSVTQSSVNVLAGSPSLALGHLFQTVAQAVGMAAHNAVAQQQTMNSVSLAVTTRCVNALVGEGQR